MILHSTLYATRPLKKKKSVTHPTPENTENRFRLLAAKGNRERGLELLNKLDAHFESGGPQSVHEKGEPFKR